MADVAKVDIVGVIGGDNSFNHLIVQPEIGSAKDLRGKTVAVDALNTAYAFQLYDILAKNGLNTTTRRNRSAPPSSDWQRCRKTRVRPPRSLTRRFRSWQ
jgi:ABC-type nitrate/sulfonate/bicarbonate transport system substrate-binding protein